MQLYIANKNYSSWSMRPWVMLKNAGIAFDEEMARFDSFDPGSRFKKTITAVNPTGRGHPGHCRIRRRKIPR
jgi:glutathione S-transferase